MALLCPVTALQYLDHLLLSGEGPHLHIYNVMSCEKKSSLQVFVDAVIHGIRIDEYCKQDTSKRRVCVFGSKKIRLVNISEDGSCIEGLSQTFELNDWIWDVKFIKWNDANQRPEENAVAKGGKEPINIGNSNIYHAKVGLACVLGHNVACYIDIYSGTNKEVIQEVHCENKCILYCALCIGTDWSNLVVAAGTVFNQIVLWKPGSVLNDKGRCDIIHRLLGHEGVIFSIDFHFQKQIIASVSDDRSLRLWKISTNNSDSVEKNTLALNDSTITQDEVLYGHKARVWDVKILDKFIVTIGEDATCCVWNYNGDVIQKYKGHKGKSIWSLAVSHNEEEMATGGGDCSIRKWSLKLEDNLHILPTKTEILRLPTDEEDDFPRSVALLSSESALTMTHNGVLWKHDLKLKTCVKLIDDKSFSSYSLLSCSQIQRNCFALGNIDGWMKVYIDEVWMEQRLYTGKLHSILWLDTRVEDSICILTTGPDGCIDIYQIEQGSYKMNSVHRFSLPYTKQRWVCSAVLVPEQSVLICGDRGGSVHVYSLNQQLKEPVQSFWKIHGKTGVTDLVFRNEHVYSCGRDSQYRIYKVTAGVVTVLTAHKVYKGFEWIAKLHVSEDDVLALGFHTDQFIVFSISSNQKLVSIPCGGGHRTWDFWSDLTSPQIDPNGGDANICYNFTYIKARDVISCTGHITYNHTVIKESLHGRELCDIKYLFSTPKSIILASCSEDTDVKLISLNYCTHVEDYDLRSISTLQGHLSSVRTLAISGPANHDIDSAVQNTDSTKQLVIRNKLQAQSPECNDIKKIMFSGGGRAEIRAWRVNFNYKNQTVEADDAEYIHCWHEFLSSHSLTEKLKLGYKPWKEKEIDPDPETRFMDMTSLCLDQLLEEREKNSTLSAHLYYLIIAACSDGLVRLLVFNEKCKKFSVLAQCTYHDHCVLKVNHVVLPNLNDQLGQSHPMQHCDIDDNVVGSELPQVKKQLYILSAATDGKIAVWNVSKIVNAYLKYVSLTALGSDNLGSYCNEDVSDSWEVECLDLGHVIDIAIPVLTIEAHQSGVNALRVLITSANSLVIASGGDDNCITTTRIHRTLQSNSYEEKQEVFVVEKQHKMMYAHSGEITGLKWLDVSTLISVSIDQRLIMWKVHEDLSMEATNCKFINISDVSNIDAWNDGKSTCLALCGVGLQLLKL